MKIAHAQASMLDALIELAALVRRALRGLGHLASRDADAWHGKLDLIACTRIYGLD